MNVALILAVIALILGAVAIVRAHGDDLAAWGVVFIAAALVFFR